VLIKISNNKTEIQKFNLLSFFLSLFFYTNVNSKKLKIFRSRKVQSIFVNKNEIYTKKRSKKDYCDNDQKSKIKDINKLQKKIEKKKRPLFVFSPSSSSSSSSSYFFCLRLCHDFYF